MKLQKEQLEQILAGLQKVKVGMIGDACIDIYWKADMTKSELSREVPHHPLPVFEERVSLGAGANVVNNLAAMGAKDIRYISFIGVDWRAELFEKQLASIGVSGDLIVSSDELVTPAYCKPIRCGISDVWYEDPRLDFENRCPIPREVREQLRENFLSVAKEADILLVSDQFQYGCVTPEIIQELETIGKKKAVLVDSRNRIAQYRHAILKPNEVETCRCLGWDIDRSSEISYMEAAAGCLLEQTEARMVLVTLGGNGSICRSEAGSTHIPAFPVSPPIDIVGAGDAFLAAFSLAFAVTEDQVCSAEFASLVSSIVIKKIGTTGSAAPDEIREAYQFYTKKAGKRGKA